MATRYKILSERELKTDLTDNSDSFIASQKAVKTAVDAKLPLAGGTLTGALSIEHADGLVLGKDVAGGTPNVAGKIKMFSSGDDALYNTFTSGDNTANATYTLPVAMPAVSGYLLSCTDAGVMSWAAAGANTALSNLASVAINTTLVSDTDNTDALGTAAISWSDLFLGSGSVITWSTAPSTADITLTHSENTLTLAGGNLALGANNLTMTGSIAATGNRVTKGWFTDIESTNMPTVGGTAILTSLTAPQFTTIELGHASDTTLSRPDAGRMQIEGKEVAVLDNTLTFTNKRINTRVVSTTSYTTDTGTSLTVADCDEFVITAQAGALKFNNPGGTPTEGQKLIIRIKDNGTARALTYDTQFRAMGTALPSTTVISKTLYLGFIFNNTDTKWDLVATAQEA